MNLNNYEFLTNNFSLLSLEKKNINYIYNLKKLFFDHILNWEPNWLFDKKYKNNAPDDVEIVKIIQGSLLYASIEDYQRVMFPMLVHEFWYNLKKDYEESVAKNEQFDFEFRKISGPALKDPKNVTLKYKLIKKSDNNLFGPKFTLMTVSFILNQLHLIEVLECLPKFPLYKSILNPTVQSYLMPSYRYLDSRDFITKQNLNSKQLEVINKVVGTIEYRNPKICLVQGPPGTGKSKTIINLIKTILVRRSANKILVCAPSNKAVDSLVIQLLDIKSIISEQELSFRIVRVGNENEMDSITKEISLTNIAKRKQQVMRKSLYHIKQDILKSYDVIACTLASCYTSHVMRDVFGHNESTKSNLKVCIVDEAGQATELLTLIPFLLGVEQLVLVGDPQQLPPTVLSKKAKCHGYDRSIFSRAQEIFRTEEINPILMLTTQYRMVVSISQWPNSYFYGGALENAASVKALGISNYILFNHKFPQDADGQANYKEAESVRELVNSLRICLKITTSNNKVRIGIITPYHKQRKLIHEELMKELENKDLIKSQIIEINTVDSFQGSERDIIIMSCVRSSGLGFTNDPNRLCVSLTRAKHTLILLGNFRAFSQNEMWKSLIDDAKKRGIFKNIDEATEIKSVVNVHKNVDKVANLKPVVNIRKNADKTMNLEPVVNVHKNVDKATNTESVVNVHKNVDKVANLEPVVNVCKNVDKTMNLEPVVNVHKNINPTFNVKSNIDGDTKSRFPFFMKFVPKLKWNFFKRIHAQVFKRKHPRSH